MLRLEDWMDVHSLHQQGLSVSAIARTLELDRKTVRKYLTQPPRPYPRRPPRAHKLDPYRAYLRERWEAGVQNGSKLFRELQQRGYPGGPTQVGKLVTSWRAETRERAFVRFETAPGHQSQIDWAHFGNWNGHRLYAFALTLGYSRMRYVEFTQSQDTEHLLACLLHAFTALGGVTETVLADNMKTVILDRVAGHPVWNPKFLDFASYYGFVPRVCHPYRPQTKGKIEATLRFVRENFWPGLVFSSLDELNQQAAAWCHEVNHRVHATTREIPAERWPQEGLRTVAGQAPYDTAYASFRLVAKDCLVSYRGSRYSVPHAYAGRRVVVKQPLSGSPLTLCCQHETIATHPLSASRGALVITAEHYGRLPQRPAPVLRSASIAVPELAPGPGVGRHYAVPLVEIRPLAVYDEVAHVAAS